MIGMSGMALIWVDAIEVEFEVHISVCVVLVIPWTRKLSQCMPVRTAIGTMDSEAWL